MSGFVFFRCSGGYNNGRHREQTKKNGIICRLVSVISCSFFGLISFFFFFLVSHTLRITDTFRD